MTMKLKALCYLVALILAPVVGPAQGADATAENERIIREAFETWEQGTYIFGDILAEDIVWTIHGTGSAAGVYTDFTAFVEEAARPVTSRLAAPLRPEVHSIWADGTEVIVRWDGSAATTGGGPTRTSFFGL